MKKIYCKDVGDNDGYFEMEVPASPNERVVMPVDMQIINSKDEDTLAKWNCLMNHWGWPKELPDEPNDRGLPHSEWKPLNRRSALMQIIEDKIGHERISWEWNKERMTKDEFRDFYDGTFKRDKKANTRYEKRLEYRCGIKA